MGANIIAESKVKISMTDLDKLDQHIDSSGRKFIGTTDKMGAGLKAMGGLFATIGVAKFAGDIFNASVTMDKMNRMLVNVEGSQAKANKRFEEFRILAKEPVLDPFNLSRFYVGLKSVNVEADLSIRFMKSLANAMAGVGAGNEEFARSMEQFVQMMGKGKLVGQDLRVIAESFPQIRKYLAEAFNGVVDPEELAKSGHTAIEVMERLNAVMEKEPHFAGGAQAAVDNFKQSLVLFESALSQNVLPTIMKFLDKLTGLMDKFSQLDAPMKTLIGTSVVGGIGLLGVAAAVTAVVNALDALGMSAGLKALTSGALAKVGGGAVVGSEGAAIGAGARGAFTALGMSIPQLMVGTIVAGTLAYYGAGALGKALGGTPSRYTPSLEYELSKEGAVFPKGAGSSIEARQQAQTMMGLKGLGFSLSNITTPLDPEAQKALDKMGNGLIEAWLSFNTEHLESYASTEAGKYKLGQRTLTNIGTAGNLAFNYTGGLAGVPMGANIGAVPRNQQLIAQLFERTMYNVPEGGAALAERDQQRTYNAMVKYYSDQEDLQGKAKDFMDSYWSDTEKGYTETSKLGRDVMNNWGDLVNDMKNGIDEVSLSWSQAVNMMVQGTDQMVYGFEDLLKRLGIDVPEGGAWGTFKNILGGVQDVMSIFSGGKAFAKGINSFAEGGSGIVTRPTLFRVGESGPEAFNIQPLSHGGKSGIGGTHIEIHQLTVPYSPDPQTAENMVVNAIRSAQRHGRLN